MKYKDTFPYICGILFLTATFLLLLHGCRDWKDKRNLEQQQEKLKAETAAVLEPLENNRIRTEPESSASKEPVMLPEYEVLYEQNPDLIGWLSIEDTVIDYPVMQTPEDENTYLYLDFNREENENGSLILDTDSRAGVGTAQTDYANGTAPSTNLIIHGHTMRSGTMFGNLELYQEEDYGKEHRIICFDSLYEKREYELIAAFFSQVYYKHEDVFKFYKFFQADTLEEFNEWYQNIKELSLYDTGVTARFGDEFITLSSCSYHVENGRFVVVGKRIS